MGNQIWSLESMTDFPPLHIDTLKYQEDMREGEDSSINLSSEDTDSSFQEALIREKVEERRETKSELTVLSRRDDDETTPHKKVMTDNSGWWDIDSEVTSIQLYCTNAKYLKKLLKIVHQI